MLKLALQYKDELLAKYINTWMNERFMYYHDSWYSELCIADNTWDKHQFVSVNDNNEVVGFIHYKVYRNTNDCDSLGIIGFSDNVLDRTCFGMDVGTAITDIFEKFRFRKLSFSVVIGNPIESTYDRLVEKYGGRIVGTQKKEVKLVDGEYYDSKLYEILASDYFNTCNERRLKK